VVKKNYDWLNGAPLLEHTARKLKVLREYLADYLRIRCKIPQQRLFRLAIVDGFAGGGRYKDGEPGSPLVIADELISAAIEISVERAKMGFAPLIIDCNLVVNDLDRDVVQMLKEQLQPSLVRAKEVPSLRLAVTDLSLPFEAAYPQIRELLDLL
jgi:three-Cys-motif partner protein